VPLERFSINNEMNWAARGQVRLGVARAAPRAGQYGPGIVDPGSTQNRLRVDPASPRNHMWVRNLLVLRLRRKSSRSPKGPKTGWGSPGGLLGVPWGLLGGPLGDDPGGGPLAEYPQVKQADFRTFGG
jgi:hypothetical protein